MLTFAPVKKMATIVAVLASVVLFSCSKDKDDDKPSYPKEVNIEYKVTSPSGLSNSDVMYTNETGGLDNIDNAALPFSKKFKRTVKQHDALALSITSMGNGNVKIDILVDDKVVKSETFSGTSVVVGSTAYAFP